MADEDTSENPEKKPINEHVDELEKQLEDLKQRLYQSQERSRELEMLQSRYEDLSALFNKIKRPPLIYAYVVRKSGPDLETGQLVVARGSDLLKVESGGVAVDSLVLGQYLWVHPQTYAVLQASEERNEGVLGKIVEMLEDGKKLVVSVEGDMSKRIIPCPPEFCAQAKIGYQVTILPPTMEILDVMPNWEVKLLLLGERPSMSYRDIGGLGHAIERIRDVIELPYKEKELFERVRLQAPRGILLHGPPGCGKTLLVKAVASENKMTFFNVSIADILSKWVGESERIVKELFKQAKERRPSIIFFDEIEALFTVRGLLDTSGVHKNIIAQILSEMDGIIDLRDVYVIGARPGRPGPPAAPPLRRDNRDRPPGQEGRRGDIGSLSHGGPAHRRIARQEEPGEGRRHKIPARLHPRRDIRQGQMDKRQAQPGREGGRQDGPAQGHNLGGHIGGHSHERKEELRQEGDGKA
jgi:proteasome-associated ATPase